MVISAISDLFEAIVMIIHALVALLLETWQLLLFILILGHVWRFIKSYVYFRPKHVLVYGLSTFVGHWLTSLSYHLTAWGIVHNGYTKVNLLFQNAVASFDLILS